MITILLSDRAYENDVYPLVKAFFPEEQVKVYQKDEYVQSAVESNQAFTILIDFADEGITFTLIDEAGTTTTETLKTKETASKSQFKNCMKRELYRLLADKSGKSLPWGILTGIRPTKLVYEMLMQKEPDEIIHQRMKEEFLCSDEKIEMSKRIAKRELELLQEMDYKNGYSLYIGIPFCPSTCLYCSFTSYPVAKFPDRVEEYLTALEKEIEFGATCFPNKKLTTVYFGGGTPTTLTAGQLDRLLGLVRQKFEFTHVKEFCVEAGRPDSITREKLEVLKKWGVDRISINPQSMQQKTLDLIGRRHTVEDIREAFHLARETGHDNINMDIIIGLPGENPEDVADTLKQIKELNPDSLTVHTLAVKRAARLNIEKESYLGLKASEVPRMLEKTIQFAKENDYLPYYLYRQKNMADNLENIGYSRFGKEGLYNILIMEEKQTILALGAGGMSKFVFHEENRIERVDNVKSLTDYIGRIDEMILRKRNFISENPTL
jgi:oxygen-independent coproporphyrinogen-3 oxidase